MIPDPGPKRPRLWLILGERRGDNSQVLALGSHLTEAYGWATEVRRLRFDPACPLPFNKRGASLVGIDLAKSDPLAAPWPDMLIGIGQRSIPAMRWIRDQSLAAEQKRPILIQLGRPRIALDLLDLVVTTPQYDLPSAGNVQCLTLPLTLRDREAMERESREWAPRFAHLPRPWNAVLVGGPSLHIACGPEEIQRLAHDLQRVLAKSEGSLLITTSPRTPREAEAILAEHLSGERCALFPFRPDGDNPYRALLALADRFIVTGDSASMLAEAIETEKPVYIFDLPIIPGATSARGLAAIGVRAWQFYRRRHAIAINDDDIRPPSFLEKLFAWGSRRGLVRQPRDISRLQKRIYDLGWARPIAEAWSDSLPALGTVAAAQMAAERRNLITRIFALWRDIVVE